MGVDENFIGHEVGAVVAKLYGRGCGRGGCGVRSVLLFLDGFEVSFHRVVLNDMNVEFFK